jgi:hypothetical protein
VVTVDALLAPEERRLCEKLAAKRDARGDWFLKVVGLALGPAIFAVVASEEKDLGSLAATFVAGLAFGVSLARSVADRREAILGKLYRALEVGRQA